jgi:hypothetical protein
MDNIMMKFIPKWRNEVLKKDRDKVIAIDGREGSGKSVLAQQLAKELDPDFNINKIAFNADEFMMMIKSTERKKGDCIILDEAFLAANSRSSMSTINRAMVGLATEMRQLNLFVIIVLPSFFDLDKYFALWRTDILLHVYFNKQGKRGSYIAFNHEKKKMLYLKGKRFYNYGVVKSGLPPMYFPDGYAVDEDEYRLKKQSAFREEKLTALEQKYKEKYQSGLLELIKLGYSHEECGKLFKVRAASIKKEVYRMRVKGRQERATNNNTNLLEQENNVEEGLEEDG